MVAVRRVYVFGSNELGIHGRGTAKVAVDMWGAVRGVGVGPTGNAYAIPTKATPSKTLPLDRIKAYVDRFIRYAEANPSTYFMLPNIGTGNAGYTDAEMAPMFKLAPSNVHMSGKWNLLLRRKDR